MGERTEVTTENREMDGSGAGGFHAPHQEEGSVGLSEKKGRMVLFRIRSFILFIYFSSPTRSPGASFYTLHPAPALSRWRRTEEEGQLKMHPQRQKQGKEEVAAKGCQAVRVGLVPTGMGPNFPARPDYTFPHLIKQNKIRCLLCDKCDMK